MFRELRGEATDTLYLPLNYRTLGKGDHKAQEVDVEEAEDEKPYEDLWCRGSELHIRLFDDDKGGVSAVVERVPCELMEGDMRIPPSSRCSELSEVQFTSMKYDGSPVGRFDSRYVN